MRFWKILCEIVRGPNHRERYYPILRYSGHPRAWFGIGDFWFNAKESTMSVQMTASLTPVTFKVAFTDAAGNVLPPPATPPTWAYAGSAVQAAADGMSVDLVLSVAGSSKITVNGDGIAGELDIDVEAGPVAAATIVIVSAPAATAPTA